MDSGSFRKNAIQGVELRAAERRLQVSKSAIVTGDLVQIAASTHPMTPEQPHPLRQGGISRDDHPAFSRGDRLRRLEAETSQGPDRPRDAAPIPGTKGFRGIFEH